MKALLTGPTGRIGSRLAPRLLAAGVDLRVLARDAARVVALQANGAEVVVGDLRTPGVFEASVKGVEAWCTWRHRSAVCPTKNRSA